MGGHKRKNFDEDVEVEGPPEGEILVDVEENKNIGKDYK